MNPKSKRAIRRHHRERLKKKRYRDLLWLRFNDERRHGIYIDTPTPCSCAMCSRNRKYEGPTVRERRQANGDLLPSQLLKELIDCALQEKPSDDWRTELDNL